MEHLIFRLSETNAGLCSEWAHYDEHHLLAESTAPALIESLREVLPHPTMKERYVTVLIPGVWVLLTQVVIPPKQHRHITSVLPFLLEEQLAEDITQTHIVTLDTYRSGHPLPVAAIQQTIMHNTLSLLKAAEVHPDMLIPDTLCIPVTERGWHVVCGDGMAWIRADENSGFNVEMEGFFAMLALMMQQTEQPKDITFTLHAMPEAPQMMLEIADFQAAYPAWNMIVQVHDTNVFRSMCTHLLNHTKNAGNHNLLQGTFKPALTTARYAFAWKKLAAIALLWCVGQLALDGGQAAYFSYRADSMRIASVALYQTTFPQDTKIIDPVRQMKQHLRLNPENQNQGLMTLLGQVASGWSKQSPPMPELQTISYVAKPPQLTLTLEAATLKSVNALTEALNTKGMNAKLTSVINDGENVKATLIIQGDPK